MSSFRLVVLVVFCMCRISAADTDLGTCPGSCIDNAICNVAKDACVCETGFVKGGAGGTAACVEVLGGSCPASTDCDSVDDSECTTDTKVCRCATGYKEENNLCVASVLGGTCKDDTDCSTTVDDSECATDTTVCKCVTGYKEENKVCVESVLDGTCKDDTDCSDTVDNSECPTGICKCVTGYKEENKVCVESVLAGTCTTDEDCKSVPNSECDTDTCKCTTGYEEKDNVCVASGSGGPRSIPCVLLMASMAIFRFSFM